MASYTTNLNLKKPAGSDNINIADINTNMDTIDSAVGTLQKFAQAGSVANNTALNNVVTPGFYLLPSSSTYTNTPPDGGVINVLMVIRTATNASTITQVGFAFNAIYYRFRTDSTTWSNWRKVEATTIT